MIINSETIALTFQGFKTVYSDAYLEAPSHSVPRDKQDEILRQSG